MRFVPFRFLERNAAIRIAGRARRETIIALVSRGMGNAEECRARFDERPAVMRLPRLKPKTSRRFVACSRLFRSWIREPSRTDRVREEAVSLRTWEKTMIR